jgi:DnaJ-class molecular chaperone
MPQIRCPECNGDGCIDLTDEDGDSDTWPCTRCDGTGQIETDEDDKLKCLKIGELRN